MKRSAQRSPPDNGAVTLKAVAVSDDGSELILARRANAKTGNFRVAIDDVLVEKLQEASRKAAEAELEPEEREPIEPEADLDAHGEELPPPRTPRPDSKLTPKEIQALLRQGRSVASIARRAGVEAEWVERFEVPIVWERAGMAARARRATLHRARRGPSALPLGEAVDANLHLRRVQMTPGEIDDAYDAVRHPKTGIWKVRFTFDSRGRSHVAEWSYEPESNELHALNTLAAELGWIDPRRRRKSSA